MTLEERADFAASLKKQGMCNCSQAVVKAFEDLLPLPNDSMMKLTAGFASGMGCMEATCGALIGANLTAGLMTGGRGTVKLAREMLTAFNEKCGATICKDLKGLETGKVLCECDQCVKNAVLIAGKFIPGLE